MGDEKRRMHQFLHFFFLFSSLFIYFFDMENAKFLLGALCGEKPRMGY